MRYSIGTYYVHGCASYFALIAAVSAGFPVRANKSPGLQRFPVIVTYPFATSNPERTAAQRAKAANPQANPAKERPVAGEVNKSEEIRRLAMAAKAKTPSRVRA